MALIVCNECGGRISDKAKACPSCGYPLGGSGLLGTISKGAQQALTTVGKQFEAPTKNADLGSLLGDLTSLPRDFSAGRTVNGIGTSIGGYTHIPGYPEIGIVRKYFCVFFIPLIPLDLYVVRNWTGSGGSFLGSITSEKAARYINIKSQALSTAFGALIMFLVFAGLLTILAMMFSR